MEKELMPIEVLIEKCERSINQHVLKQSLKFIGEKYTSIRCEEKYLVEGYEYLSILAQNIIKSGRGYYIVNYAHKTGTNVCVTGINNKDLLIDYTKWCFEQGKKALTSMQEEILKLLEEENNMTVEEIRLKNLEYLETQRKIFENIFDMEAKKPYCEKLQTIRTVEQVLDSFMEMSLLFLPLGDELKRLGAIQE